MAGIIDWSEKRWQNRGTGFVGEASSPATHLAASTVTIDTRDMATIYTGDH
jgi:hypothetical protein